MNTLLFSIVDLIVLENSLHQNKYVMNRLLWVGENHLIKLF